MPGVNGTTVVLAGLLIDGTGGDPIRDATVVVERGRITRVGPRSQVTFKAGESTILDVSDRVVTPGLIDSHCHLFHIGRHYDAPTVSFIARAIQHAAMWLETGVTTVRDISARKNMDIDMRDAINAGLVRGPRLFVSGSGLAATGGGPVPESPNRFVIEITGADEARRVARQQLRAGVDFIKLFATAGVPSGRPEMNYDEIRAAVEEAHKAGKHVAAHAHATSTIKDCARAGVNTIEHGRYLDEEAVAMMAERGMFLVPTLSIAKTMGYKGAEWGRSAQVMEYARRALEAGRQGVRMAREAGVKIAAGTDPPYVDTVPMECVALVEAGLTPMEAIIAATRRGAEILGKTDDFGTLEVGQRADLAVVPGNPLDDIAVLERVEIVMKDGVVVKPTA